MSLYSAKLSDNRLRKLLHSKFGQPQVTRNPKTVHVSMLTDGDWGGKEYCARESALAYSTGLEYGTRWIGTAERLTYDVGWFLQHEVTRRLIAHLLGEWHCQVCDAQWRGKYAPCECGNPDPRYGEMHFRSIKSGVMGSIDMCLDLGFPKAVIVEVKSMEKEKFNGLAMPTLEHRRRVIGYLRLLRECSETDPWIKNNIELEFGYVLYISKGLGKYFKYREGGVKDKYSPFQEFLVKAEGGAKSEIDEMFERASMYWAWRNADQSEQIPPRIYNCPNSECKRAIKCRMRKECWDV